MRILLPTLTAVTGFAIGFSFMPDQPVHTSTGTGPTSLVEAVFTPEALDPATGDLSLPLTCLDLIDSARRAQDWDSYLNELTPDTQSHETGILAQALVLIAQSPGCRNRTATAIRKVLADHRISDLETRYVDSTLTIGRRISDQPLTFELHNHNIDDPIA